MTSSIVAIGESLWDVYPDERHPGGAPTNVAFHAARLGNDSSIITRVGEDEAGEQLVAYLREHGVNTSFVQRDRTKPTGTVKVEFQHEDPCYTVVTDVAWDYLAATDEARERVTTADAVCFVSLAQRHDVARRSIHKLLADARGQAQIVFDVNLRPPFVSADVLDASLRLSNVVKMGESELQHVSSLMGRSNLIEWLINEIGVDAVCVTRGERGASMTTKSSNVDVAGVGTDTSNGDPVGAGDAFVAALTHQLVRGSDIGAMLQFANRYAALVAARRGAMPVLAPSELAELNV
jgi:fructokinase